MGRCCHQLQGVGQGGCLIHGLNYFTLKTTFAKPTLQAFSRLIEAKFITETGQISAFRMAPSAQRFSEPMLLERPLHFCTSGGEQTAKIRFARHVLNFKAKEKKKRI